MASSLNLYVSALEYSILYEVSLGFYTFFKNNILKSIIKANSLITFIIYFFWFPDRLIYIQFECFWIQFTVLLIHVKFYFLNIILQILLNYSHGEGDIYSPPRKIKLGHLTEYIQTFLYGASSKGWIFYSMIGWFYRISIFVWLLNIKASLFCKQ